MKDDQESMKRKLFAEDPALHEAYLSLAAARLAAQEIRRTRESLGLTQIELGRRAGISHQAVAKLESAESAPNIRTLLRLARAFGAKLELRFSKDGDG